MTKKLIRGENSVVQSKFNMYLVHLQVVLIESIHAMTLFHSSLLILIIHQNFAQNDNLKDEGRYILDMQHCGCKRKIKKPSFNKIVSLNQTTCSLDAYNRGMGQKIIGFSLYGNHTDKLMYVFIFIIT